MIIEKSSDYMWAYSENCEGIYAAGESMEAVKNDTEKVIELIKKNFPKSSGRNPCAANTL